MPGEYRASRLWCQDGKPFDPRIVIQAKEGGIPCGGRIIKNPGPEDQAFVVGEDSAAGFNSRVRPLGRHGKVFHLANSLFIP